jgi:hypothetical protein
MDMKTITLKLISTTIAASLIAGGVQAEVFHKQVNAENLITHVSDDSWQPEGFVNGTPVPATFIAAPGIVIDGRDTEQAWLQTQEVEVPLAYGSVDSARLRVLYTDDEVFIRVRWADDTENRQHHPWTWDAASSSYVPGPQVEDSLILSFEAGCEWAPSFLAGYVYDFDGWQWLAARSDPLGQAVDLYGTVQDQYRKHLPFTEYPSRNSQDIWNMKFTENSNPDLHADWDQLDRVYMLQPFVDTVWVSGQPDGRVAPPFVEQIPAPVSEPSDPGQTVPQFRPLKLEGEAGEISAKGYWQDGFWTVEYRRDLVTPAQTLNDTVFNRTVQFSVHVFDGVERIDQSSESGRLFLRFMEPGLPDDDLLVAEESSR